MDLFDIATRHFSICLSPYLINKMTYGGGGFCFMRYKHIDVGEVQEYVNYEHSSKNFSYFIMSSQMLGYLYHRISYG